MNIEIRPIKSPLNAKDVNGNIDGEWEVFSTDYPIRSEIESAIREKLSAKGYSIVRVSIFGNGGRSDFQEGKTFEGYFIAYSK